MIIPFNHETFQQDMKPQLSMAFRALEYENIESSITKVCAELSDKLGKETYNAICGQRAGNDNAGTDDGNTGIEENYAGTEESNAGIEENNEAAPGEDTPQKEALDYLQRAILHFALYHHIIYLIANVDNDGVTVTKSDNKTTIYKYQQDQLEEHLIGDAWFWLNRLITFLNNHEEAFPEWKDSEEHNKLASLPVTIEDFEQCVGVDDPTFLLYAGWIVREVYRECIQSRQKDKALTERQKMAICYDVMARACRRLAFHALPAPIRIDINNEMGKNHAAQADTTIREKVACIFADKASAYWKAVDTELQEAQTSDTADYGSARRLTEHDKFVM